MGLWLAKIGLPLKRRVNYPYRVFLGLWPLNLPRNPQLFYKLSINLPSSPREFIYVLYTPM